MNALQGYVKRTKTKKKRRLYNRIWQVLIDFLVKTCKITHRDVHF